jgi:hypothetical protein
MAARLVRIAAALVAGLIAVLIFSSQVEAQNPTLVPDLSIDEGDYYIEAGDGGYHLYIRKKPDINSVLLTESTKDPAGRIDNLAYRAQNYNSINGDEIRVLNGEPISWPPHSLIDSTPEANERFGDAFHIFLPYIMIYGQPETRHGEVYVTEGTWINIRSFSRPYADYRGRFRENPFEFRFVQHETTETELPEPTFPPSPPPGTSYPHDTVETFQEISRQGETLYAPTPDEVINEIENILNKESGKSVDLVICLDATASMRKYMDAIKAQLSGRIESLSGQFKSIRVGMVLYKDYSDDYLNKVIPFTDNFIAFNNSLRGVSISGGLDIPEAVHEALYEGALRFPWEAESRQMILIGDAPPHPEPQGSITLEKVEQETAARNIRVSAIILPR